MLHWEVFEVWIIKDTVLEYTHGFKYIMYFQISVVLINLFIYKYVTWYDRF